MDILDIELLCCNLLWFTNRSSMRDSLDGTSAPACSCPVRICKPRTPTISQCRWPAGNDCRWPPLCRSMARQWPAQLHHFEHLGVPFFGLVFFGWLFAPDAKPEPLVAWSLGFLFFVSLATLIWSQLFRCPRCNERFSKHVTEGFTPDYCTSCGLPDRSTSTTEVSREFLEWQKTKR